MQRLGLAMCSALLCTLFAALSPSVAADEASTVSGTVTKVDGSPVAGARVRQIHTGFVYGETTTGPDGNFEMAAGGGFLEVLPPVGRNDMAAFNLDDRNRVPGQVRIIQARRLFAITSVPRRVRDASLPAVHSSGYGRSA